MSGGDERTDLLERARHADEETRYRAVLELDGGRAPELRELFDRLGDASWRVRAAAIERLAALPEPGLAVPRLLELLEEGETIGARDAAGAVLARIGAPALPGLVERLGGPSVELKLAVAPVIGAIGERRCVPALTARLADPDANVRAAAADALGRLGGPEAAAALLAALDSDDQTLRTAALEALGAVRVAPPVRAVAPLLGDRALRPAIFRALGGSDEPAALDLLAGGLAERSRTAREAALGAIGQQRSRHALAELARLADGARAAATHEPGAADACVAALASDDPFVPVGALTALAFIAEPRHVAAMARAAADDRLRPLVEEALDGLPRGTELMVALGQVLAELPPLARLTVRGALAVAGSLTALQALVDDAAGDPDPRVQAEAVAELGRVGDARAVPALGGLLGDDQPALSGVAAAALVRVAQRAPEGRRAVLLECRARAAAGPSAALFRVLGAVGEGEDLRLVRDGLAGGEVARRVAAAAAVAALGARGVLAGEHVPELVAALSDPAWQVRAAAARAFVELAEANADDRLGDPEAGEHPLCAMAMRGLAAALDDAEPGVRAAAAEALGACGRPEHTARIAALAADPAAPPVVAVAALRALARLGAADPWVIERGLGHPDPEVVKQAVAAAARLPGPDGARLLRAAAASPRWDVRHAAARGMAERRDPALRDEAARLARSEPDALVARAFAEAATLLAGRSRR